MPKNKLNLEASRNSQENISFYDGMEALMKDSGAFT